MNMGNPFLPIPDGDDRNGDWAGKEAYVALGSNLGDREVMLLEALRLLHTHDAIRVLRVSGIYETDPVGMTNQPPFLNMAAAVATLLSPLGLLR
jgi:2-amino-4-hydroxy-6-hydroxymethyldihydropteridine diphosphokinase